MPAACLDGRGAETGRRGARASETLPQPAGDTARSPKEEHGASTVGPASPAVAAAEHRALATAATTAPDTMPGWPRAATDGREHPGAQEEEAAAAAAAARQALRDAVGEPQILAARRS